MVNVSYSTVSYVFSIRICSRRLGLVSGFPDTSSMCHSVPKALAMLYNLFSTLELPEMVQALPVVTSANR